MGLYFGHNRYIATYSTIKFGLLYNRYAMWDSRHLLSSDDWVVTSQSDIWDVLHYLLGSNGGDKLRDTGTTYWSNSNGTNTLNFNARGSGIRYYNGVFASNRDMFIGWLDSGTYVNYYIEVGNSGLYFNSYANQTGAAIRARRSATSSELLLSDGTACSAYMGNDGKKYRTIKRGSLVFMADNLAETKYRNGDLITEVTDNTAWAGLTTGALCAYNNDWNYV